MSIHLILMYYNYRYFSIYKKDIKLICKWLGIKAPKCITFLPWELGGKCHAKGLFHYGKNVIIIRYFSDTRPQHSEIVVRTIAHEIMHYFQKNILHMDMSNNNEREIEAIALTNAYMLDRNSQNVTVGKVREFFSRTSGGNAPE